VAVLVEAAVVSFQLFPVLVEMLVLVVLVGQPITTALMVHHHRVLVALELVAAVAVVGELPEDLVKPKIMHR
jgi:hypothetical protein